MSKDKSKDIPTENQDENKENQTVSEQETQQVPETEVSNPLAEELAKEKEKYLRLAAEYDNFRKRSQKEREALFTDIRCDTILKLLPVYDNLDRALRQKTDDAAFFKGVEMTMTQLKNILESIGVVEIPAVGEKFNPERHNAVMHIENADFGENEIVEEFEKGFMLGDKVIRFSTVKVAN